MTTLAVPPAGTRTAPPAESATRPSWRRARYTMTVLAFLLPSLVPLLAFVIGPMIAAAWMSLHAWNLIGPMQWVGFDNYERLFSRRGFLEALWTSFIFVFFSAIVGQSVLGFLLAATLRGSISMTRTVVEVCIMLGWLLPDIVAAFLWSATTSQTGIINSLLIVPLGLKPINFINDFALRVVIIANV